MLLMLLGETQSNWAGLNSLYHSPKVIGQCTMKLFGQYYSVAVVHFSLDEYSGVENWILMFYYNI